MYVALGGDLAGVHAYPLRNPPAGYHPSWTAQARRPSTDRPREFTCHDIPFKVEACALMPLEEVIGIVLHFVEHGELAPTHVWLSPQGARYPQFDVNPPGGLGDIPF